MAETFGIAYVIGLAFVVILAICWIILPFALIGTKQLLRELIRETRRTNELLDQRLPPLRAPPPDPSR